MGNANKRFQYNETDEEKVRLYTKLNGQGEVYEIETGNYISDNFISKITPNNIFSMSIPPATTVKLFCGDVYDYGNIGSMHVTNVTRETIIVPELPSHIQGRVRSISITKHQNKNQFGTQVINAGMSGVINKTDILAGKHIEQFNNHEQNKNSECDQSNESNILMTNYLGMMILILIIITVINIFMMRYLSP